jgi:hypothetical protein
LFEKEKKRINNDKMNEIKDNDQQRRIKHLEKEISIQR